MYKVSSHGRLPRVSHNDSAWKEGGEGVTCASRGSRVDNMFGNKQGSLVTAFAYRVATGT